MNNRSIKLPMTMIVFLFLVAFMAPVSGAQVKDWTFMVYMAADNNLEGGAELDIMELEMTGSTDEVNFVVQIDRSGNYSGNTHLKWSGAQRYYITKSGDPHKVTSEPLVKLGDVDMAAPETLLDFVAWASENYPAQRYAIILWNHGTGWKEIQPSFSEDFAYQPTPAIEGTGSFMDDISFNISYDETSKTSMSIPSLHKTLGEASNIIGQKIDLLGFDACLMQMVEVAWAAKPFAKYQVGSPDLEPEKGWPYDMIAERLVANPGMGPEELGKVITESYRLSYSGGSQGNTAVILSLMNLEKLDFFKQNLDHFCDSVRQNIRCIDIIETARNDALKYSYGDYIDLGHFLSLLGNSNANSAIKLSANRLLAALRGSRRLEGLVTNIEHNGDKFDSTTGLSIFFPTRQGFRIYMHPYSELTFASETEWFNLLNEISVPNIPYLKLKDIVLEDNNKDGRIAPGEEVTVYLSVHNIGKQTLSTAEIFCETDSSILDAKSYTAKISKLPSPQKTSLIKAFKFKVSKEALIHSEVNLSFTLKEDNIPDSTLKTTFYIREPFATSGHALLVITDNFSPPSPILQQMLTDAGVTFDIWDRQFDGELRTEVLRRYIDGWVFVASQDSTPEQTLNEEEVDALDEFLGIGGRLVLNGQDIGFSLRESEFLETRCRTIFVQDDVNVHVVSGADGFLSGNHFNIFGGDGANNQKWPDEIDALPGGSIFFKYEEGARDMADDRYMVGPNHKPGSLSRGIKSSGGAAVKVVDGYRLMLFGFGIEAISAKAQRTQLMKAIIEFMQPDPMTEIHNFASAATRRTRHRNISETAFLERADLLSTMTNRLVNDIKERSSQDPGAAEKAISYIQSFPGEQKKLLNNLEKNIRALLEFEGHHGTLEQR